MKILFVSENRMRHLMPAMPLGLASIIAQIDESRHEIRVLDMMFYDEPVAELESILLDFSPDIVAISIRNLDNQTYLHTEYLLPEAKEVVDVCRDKSSARIVIGGPAFTVTPRAIFEYFNPDFGITGEGEIAFPELVERIETNADWSDIPGLLWRNPEGVRMNPPMYVEDLDSLRLPRRELFDNERYAAAGGFGNIVLKQGCSFGCLYCDSPTTMGRQWRMKSPEKVADELEAMHNENGINVAFFTDAIFNFPLEHAKKVCRAIKQRKLAMFWIATVSPAYLDREFAELMRDAGCNAVSLGCDSASEKMLKILHKPFNKKQLRDAAEILEEVGINYVVSLMIGAPGENRETVDESIRFMKERSPFTLDFCVGIRLMPNTALRDIAGVISADDPLMEPRFYISPDVKDWVADYLREVCLKHPNWTVAHEEG